MRSTMVLALTSLLFACGGATAEDDAQADDAHRVQMRSEIEGEWTGTYWFSDRRPPTRMTLRASYAGSGQIAPQCGSRLLGAEGSPGPTLQCISAYELPLEGALSTLDGALSEPSVPLRYESYRALYGEVLRGQLRADLHEGTLKGSLQGPLGGTFSLVRK